MKIKIKGLVFAGAAAAIMLSAGGAYAAKSTAGRSTNDTLHGVTENMGNPGVVTSEKYTKAEYEWVKNKVDGSTWTATVSNADARAALIDDDYYPSTATMATAIAEVAADLETTREITGDGDYTYVTTVAASGTEGQAGYVPAHKEVGIIDANLVTAPSGVNVVTEDNVPGNENKLVTASAVQKKLNVNDGKAYVGKDKDWKEIAGDAGNQTLTNTAYVSIHTENDGSFKAGLDSAKVKAYDGTTTANNRVLTSDSQKLVTEGVLDANVRLGAKATNNGATPSVNQGQLVYIGNDGLIEMSNNSILAYDTTTNAETETITANSSSNVTVPTTKNVYEFVTKQLGGVEVSYDTNCNPATTKEAGFATNCALVMGRSGNTITMTWKEMAGNPASGN